MHVKINNWDKYHHRTDIKRMNWFRVESDIMFDPKLSELGPETCWLFICLLGFAAREISAEINLPDKYVKTHTKVDTAKHLKLLIEHGLVTDLYGLGTDSVRTRTDSYGFVPYITEQDTTEQDTTEHNTTEQDTERHEFENDFGESQKRDTPDLAELWNSNCVSLPKIRTPVSQSRKAKIKARARSGTSDEWAEVITRVAKSDFCNGLNDRSWVATFDWILKPDTFDRVIEGKYDNRGQIANSDLRLKAQWERIERGEV